MGRSIVTAKAASTVASRSRPSGEPGAAQEVADSYGDALLKLIPAEVIGIYLAMQTILTNAKPQPNIEIAFIVVFLFGIFATVFYLRVTLKVTNTIQLMLSVGAFCVWAFSLVPEAENYSWHNGTYAGLLLLAYTFIAPKIPLEAQSK